MPPTPTDAKLCPACGIRKSGAYPGGLCRRCYDIQRAGQPPLTPAKFGELTEKLKIAERTGDWKQLADELQPTVVAIANGTVKASAAQAALIKAILDRAYGRVTKSAEDKSGPIGVVVLPVFGSDALAQICPECLDAHKLHELK